MSEHSTEPPETGDEQVDRALADFAAHRGDADLAARLDAATEAHRRLQQRLTNPGAGPTTGD
jgi:hypothetical protein